MTGIITKKNTSAPELILRAFQKTGISVGASNSATGTIACNVDGYTPISVFNYTLSSTSTTIYCLYLTGTNSSPLHYAIWNPTRSAATVTLTVRVLFYKE